MWLNIHQANVQREAYEAAQGMLHDVVVRMRSDIVFQFNGTNKGFDLRTLTPTIEPGVVYEPLCGRYLNGLNDQLFIGSGATLSTLSLLYFTIPRLYMTEGVGRGSFFRELG